jgi:hypothetical protein
MPGIYNPTSQFTGGAEFAINGWMSGWKAQPIVMPIEPWWRPGDLTFVQPGAKLITRQSVPVHAPGVQPWDGAWQFSTPTGLFIECHRAIWQKGVKANIIKLAEFDESAFDMSPATMAIELGNNPGLCLVAILNGCFSGVPQDAAGNPFPPELGIIATDQVYGGSLAVVDGDTGNYKLVNPADPSFMSASKWFNAHENFDVTDPTDYVPVLENMQQRRAMNGIELQIGDEGLELWVNFGRKERVRLLLEVFRELAQSGIVTPYVIQAGVNNTAVNSMVKSYNDQVLFGAQTNPVFGRMKVRALTGLRSDLACVVAPRPAALPQYSAFVYAHGGQVGQYAIQTDPAAMRADTVPHIAVYQWTQQSPMFFGVPGTSAGDIGISMLLNEGFASVSGLLFEYLFTGSAS